MSYSSANAAKAEASATSLKDVKAEKVKSASQSMVRDGIAVEFRAVPLNKKDEGNIREGDHVSVEFHINDAQTGQPIKGLYPAVWLDLGEAWNQKKDNKIVSCKDRVQVYLQGIVGMRPMVDLNSYFVLVMNQDATISVIDPIIGITGITKLYASINLKAPGAEWAKTKDEKHMFVTMPVKKQVAVINLDTFKVKTNIDAGNNPIRAVLQPNEKYLWVGNNSRKRSESGVTIIDVKKQKKIKFIKTGKGHHEITFSKDGKFVYVSNRDSGTISIIDAVKLKKKKTIKIGSKPTSVFYSEKSESVYVTDGEKGEIVVIDDNKHHISKRIKSKPGIGPAGISQDGRWLVVANTAEDEIYAIDTATNTIRHTLAVGRKPYQVSFSRAFVYIRSLGSERVNMVELAHLDKKDSVPVASFPAGAVAPGKVRDVSIASAMQEAPGEAAMLVVSPADNTVYYYMEGMNAPMGNFRNYGHRPRAVQVADRTLREGKDGVYRAKVKLPTAGKYDVAFLMESPRILHCFSMEAERDEALQKKQVRTGVEFINQKRLVTVGEDVSIRFRISDPETGKSKKDLKDVRVRYYRAPAFDRKEVSAVSVGDGVYELKTKLNTSGVYYFHVSSASSKLQFGDDTFLSLQVTAKKQ